LLQRAPTPGHVPEGVGVEFIPEQTTLPSASPIITVISHTRRNQTGNPKFWSIMLKGLLIFLLN
jgi:hypothetical protein